jgi:histidyl-tRNA synthetase
MNNLQSPRGTRDILPDEQSYWQQMRAHAEATATRLNFKAITVPTYEYRELFQRSIGQGTDVMDKELFLTRGIETPAGEEEYALRPEGTAGIARAFIEHGMHTWPQPVKLWSWLNVFRYDRPQRGRYREHTQFDLEIFGDESPWADAWVILAGHQFIAGNGVGPSSFKVKVNSLGTTEERAHFIEALRAFLEERREQLTEESQRRLQTNPLRILDSKSEADQQLLLNAPQLSEFLGEESRQHFAAVLGYLQQWPWIQVVVDPRLVRGLDYYNHTTFEWVPAQGDGQQSSLGGGGRYDGLVKQLGGPDVPAVGAGIGIDRLIEFVKDLGNSAPQAKPVDYFLVAADEQGKELLISRTIPELIAQGKRFDAAFGKGSMAAQLKAADRSGAPMALIAGEQEVQSGQPQEKPLH